MHNWDILGILLGCIFIFASVVILILIFLYDKFNMFVSLFHDRLGWHTPDMILGCWSDDCGIHGVCKHCGKFITYNPHTGEWV